MGWQRTFETGTVRCFVKRQRATMGWQIILDTFRFTDLMNMQKSQPTTSRTAGCGLLSFGYQDPRPPGVAKSTDHTSRQKKKVEPTKDTQCGTTARRIRHPHSALQATGVLDKIIWIISVLYIEQSGVNGQCILDFDSPVGSPAVYFIAPLCTVIDMAARPLPATDQLLHHCCFAESSTLHISYSKSATSSQ